MGATVGLAMLVREGSKIAERALASAEPHVDAVTVLYSGEPDDGMRARLEAIMGVDFQTRPFTHVAEQRTELLRRASGSADYLLVMDDDHELQTAGLPRELDAPLYMVEEEQTGVVWKMPRLLDASRDWTYAGGPAHEYLIHDAGPAPLAQGMRLIHHNDGEALAVKLTDARGRLEQAVAADPSDARSTLYLANTLRDLNLWLEAAAMYERRVNLSGWSEEQWFALYMKGVCQFNGGLQGLGRMTLMSAFMMRPSRAEPLYAICRGMLPPESDVLWIEPAAYYQGVAP